MTTDEERMRILKMLEAGQISAVEAAELLEALGEGAEAGPAGKERKARWFRVRITDTKSGKKKININIPIGLAKMGMGMAGQFSDHVPHINIKKIISAIETGHQGHIVDVDDDERGERIEIYVE